MIFEKRRSYSTVLFIPREYFGLKNFKLNANKSNYPAKNYFIVMIFQNRRSYQLFYLFLDLILCQFWNEHPHRVSYQSDQAPVDAFKVPLLLQLIIPAVWARKLANLFTNKWLFTTLTGQHNEITLRPSSKCT